MLISNQLRLRHLLSIVLIFCTLQHTAAQRSSHYDNGPTFQNAGPIQLGLKDSYLMPRNEFGMDFKRASAYEIYCQFRNKGGAGRLTARVGLFYTNLKPRLDTIPTYLIQEPSVMLYPGYIVYKNMYLLGITMDDAYSVVHFQNFRLDIGFGIIVGKSHQEYERGYATILTEDGNIDSYIGGLRGHLTAGYQFNKYIEAYIEGLDAFITKTDWSSQFHHSTIGIGVNISFKPSANDY